MSSQAGKPPDEGATREATIQISASEFPEVAALLLYANDVKRGLDGLGISIDQDDAVAPGGQTLGV